MRLRDLIRRRTAIGEMLTFADDDRGDYAEIHLAASAQEEMSDGLVRKDILRTGTWPVIPTKQGIIKKPLTITRTGQSDREKGIISLESVKQGFDALKGKFKVQVPLSDDDEDHKNITRLNTGFVEDVWIEGEDENARLVAAIKFTEADVKEKVLNGTYGDVSCGIPWEMTSRGEKYTTPLEHVCITNRPFIDGLGGFLAMSDHNPDKIEVVHFAEPGDSDPDDPDAPPQPRVVYRDVDPFGGLSLLAIMEQAKTSLPETFAGFAVLDVSAKGLTIEQDGTRQKFLVPFKVEESKVIPQPEGWTFIKTEGDPPPEPVVPPPPPEVASIKPESSGDAIDKEMAAARTIRNARLGVAASDYPSKEGYMPLSREELEALNLSDMPEAQRAAFHKLIDENSGLSASSKTTAAEKRITELEGLGLKAFPGALKLYRDVMLSDDGGPAIVVLSDDGREKKSLTALNILDNFIEAIKGAEGRVHLSDQASLVPDDVKPPSTPEGEKKPLSDRVAEAKAALAGVNGR